MYVDGLLHSFPLSELDQTNKPAHLQRRHRVWEGEMNHIKLNEVACLCSVRLHASSVMNYATGRTGCASQNGMHNGF